MKEKTLMRLDRLEEVIRQSEEVSLVAIRDAHGIHWNGGVYADDESFDQAVRLIRGEKWEEPIVVINIHHPQVESAKNEEEPL